jgi:hypothetical protein
MSEPMTPEETVAILRKEVNDMHDLHARVLRQMEIEKERADHWRRLCDWTYARSRQALMVSAQKPIEGREARDVALCEINKKIGGALN